MILDYDEYAIFISAMNQKMLVCSTVDMEFIKKHGKDYRKNLVSICDSVIKKVKGAEKVVHCENCVHLNERNSFCNYHYATVNPTWFCWAGEEKESNNEIN